MDDGEAAVTEDMLPTLIQWFEDAEDQTDQARLDAERDRDYYDGKQYTPEEREELKARKQPAIVDNRIRRKIDYLAGLEKQARQDPKAFPRNPQDEHGSEAATDGLRFVADSNRFPQTKSRVWENMLIEGCGGVDVCVEEGGPHGYKIIVKRVAWDRLFYDPHSSEPDFSDAKYLGIVIWMDEDDVLAKWPGSEDIIESTYIETGSSETYDDKPRYAVWSDAKRRRVRVVQIYWNTPEGWQYAAFTRGGYFDEQQPSPYLNEDKAPICPLVFVSAYVDRDNARYGVVRDMIDPSDENNKRRGKAMHLLSVRQVIAEEGAVRDVDAARKELAKPDGYIEVTPQMRFEIQQTADLAAGQVQLMLMAQQSIDGMGPNASMQGKQQDKGASGIALARSQQGGLIEVGTLLDMLRDWARRVYEQIWLRIRQFWTAETWIRVTDDEMNVKFVGLNVQSEPMWDDTTGQMMAGPVQNAVADTMVDIVIDEAPDVVTLQSEQQAVLGDVMKSAPQLVPALIEPFLRSTSLRNKDEIIKRVNEAMQAPPPPNPQMLEVERKAKKDQADVALDTARLDLDAAKAEADVMARMSQPEPQMAPA